MNTDTDTMPTDPFAAVATLEAWLNEQTDYPCEYEGWGCDDTVAELLADRWNISPWDVRARLADHPVLDWKISIRAEWKHHEVDTSVTVYAPIDKWPYSEWLFDEGGIDYHGGDAIAFLMGECHPDYPTLPRIHQLWGMTPNTQGA